MRKKERKQVGEQLASTQDIEKEFEEFGVKKRVNRHPPVQIRYEGNVGVYSKVDSSKLGHTESKTRLSKVKDVFHRSKKVEEVVEQTVTIVEEQLYKQVHTQMSMSITLCKIIMNYKGVPEKKIEKTLRSIESLIVSGADVLEPIKNGMSLLSFTVNNLVSTPAYYALYNGFMQVCEINASSFIERWMRSNGEINSYANEDFLRIYIADCITDDINDILDDGDTWLHRACRQGDKSAIVAFIALRANHKSLNRSGVAPLALIVNQDGLYDFYTNTIAQLSPFLRVETPTKIELGVELLRTPEIIRKVSSQPYHHNPEHLSYSSDSQEYDIERAPSFIKDSLRKSPGIPKSQSYGSDLSKSPKGNGGHSK